MPDKITDEMLNAGQRAWLEAGGHDCDSLDLVEAIYTAMSQAHPTDEEEVERVARAVTDALWPVLGGNNTAAELWDEIGEAVRSAALNAIRRR